MQFQIDPANHEPIYRQLIMQVREAVAQAELVPGDRLPSLRELSRTLVVNPNTIARAYSELERDGILNSRPGLGVFVAEPKTELRKKVCRDKLIFNIDQVLTEAVHFGFSWDEVQSLLQERADRFQWNINRAIDQK